MTAPYAVRVALDAAAARKAGASTRTEAPADRPAKTKTSTKKKASK